MSSVYYYDVIVYAYLELLCSLFSQQLWVSCKRYRCVFPTLLTWNSYGPIRDGHILMTWNSYGSIQRTVWDYSEEKEQLWTNSLYLAMFHSLVAGMSFCNFGWVFSLAQIFSHMRWVFFVCVQGFFPWVSWPHTLNKGPLVTCVTVLAHPCLLLYCGCVTVLGRHTLMLCHPCSYATGNPNSVV